ncbi:MAG: hypothetical protein FWC55_09910 [Firmicutes bacterium]|nr:hypothetical protein [Bacillota bacterium]
MTDFIFTSQDDSWDMALAEARDSLKGVGFALRRWLRRGVGLASAEGGFSEISVALANRGPVFIRHIFPVEFVADMADFAGDFLAGSTGNRRGLGETSGGEGRRCGDVAAERRGWRGKTVLREQPALRGWNERRERRNMPARR